MEQIVKKWGNSLAVRLPKGIAKALNLREGSKVEIKLEGEKIVVVPKRDLSELLNRITPESLHNEVDWGQREGNEVW